MFSAYCHQHESNVLLPLNAITHIGPLGPEGRTVEFLCHCGHHGSRTLRRF